MSYLSLSGNIFTINNATKTSDNTFGEEGDEVSLSLSLCKSYKAFPKKLMFVIKQNKTKSNKLRHFVLLTASLTIPLLS